MKGKFLNTKNVVIGLVSLVLIGASATGVTVFLKNRGEAAAAQEENQVQNLPTTGNDNQVNQGQNNSGNVIENPTNPETPVTPVNPTTPGTTTPGSTTTRPSTGTTTPSREEISQEIEETVRIERQKVFEDLQLSWTTIGIPAITANMGIYKPELQIEKTATAVLKAGESEQIPVKENNKPMVRAGDTVIYTIRVLNLGNYKATNVVVTDSLDVIFDGKTVPANEELVKIETLEAGKAATLKVGYVVKQEDINAVLETEQNEIISKDIINIATATDGKTTVEDEDDMPVNPDVTINVNKNWQDNDNQDGKRPEKITVELYKNNENEPVATATMDASTDWKYVFSKLPKYDENKNEITYKVVEVTVPEYDTEYEITDNEVEIYNHHTPETTSISGRKTWNDSSNQDGVRPDSITVELLKTVNGTTTSMGENYKQVLTGNENELDYSWSDLPVYEAGKEITYTVKEVGESNGKIAGKNEKEYTVKYDGMNITNSYAPEKTSISGRKTWNDSSNQDGVRPDSITVELLKTVDGTTTSMGDNYKRTLTGNTVDTVDYSWSDLPVYETGKRITYTVKEVGESNGKIVGKNGKEYTVEYDGMNIKNSYAPETTSISGRKTWNDKDNQDGVRPDSITVELLKTVDDTTTSMGDSYKRTLTGSERDYSWSELPVYEAGKEITYTVKEVGETNSKIAGKNGKEYTVEYDGMNIKNSYTPEKTSISCRKTWVDLDSSTRPSSITVNLLADGTKVTDKTVTVTASDNWAWSFTNLDKYNAGTEIVYSIEEITVPRYTAVVDGYNITNTIKQEYVTLSGTKTWLDPEGTTHPIITLGIKQNGSNELYTVNGNPYTFTLENNETEYVFNSLPKYKTEIVDGEEKLVVKNSKVELNTYEVVEVTELTDYTVEYSGVSKVGYNFVQNITNRLNQTTISLKVNKVWHDNVTASERPEITIILNKNGEFYDSKKIPNSKSSCTFENLERYTFNNDGTCSENIYTITEETVNGYDVDTSSEIVKNGNEWTKTIINTKTQEKINIEGTKTWNCVPDGETKPTVIVELFRDYQDGDQAIDSTEVVKGKYSFTDLDKFSPDDYHEYQYTVREIVPDGYIATYDGYNITNTKQITATKTAETSTGVKEVNIGETIEYRIIITNNTEVATEVKVKDNILELNHQDNNSVEVELDTEKSITLEGKPLTAEEIQALYNGTFKVQMPATATRTIVIPIKVTAGMTGNKIKNTAYVNGKPTNEVINPIERTVAVTRYKNNLSSTNIILVLDVSSSMEGDKIKTAKQAIVDFINATYKIPENKDVTFTLITFAKREYTEGARGDQQGKKYKYHGGLFEFNDSGENKGKYEYGCGNSIITLQNHEDFKTAFNGLLTDRGTNMRAGLEVAYATIYGESENTISKLYPSYDKVVIFFGDGEPYGETKLKNNPEGIREAAGWLKAKKAKVYSIGFGNGASKGTKGYERLKDISSDGKVYTSSNYTQLIKNFSDIISADPVVYPYTIDGNAVVELTAESTQKIVVDEKNPIIIKIGDAPEIKITDAATAEAYKITYTDKKIIWDVKEYSKDTNLRISYHVQ